MHPNFRFTFAVKKNNISKTDMKTIYDAFKQQVSTQPNALAVMDETIELTIAELDAMATEIASGFPVEHPAQVGIVMQHGVRQIIY